MKARAVPEFQLVFWGFCLNGLWEALQSPLYTDFHRGLGYLVLTRLHCTGGDVLLLLAAFWVVSLAFHTRDWAGQSGLAAPALFVSLGLAYTVWSELHNTQIVRTWAYNPRMPVILGIGLAPLLQWSTLPLILVAVLRRRQGERTPRLRCGVREGGPI
jgi:hypothetical protein